MNEHEICGRCGRKLKTEKSRAEGFGPKCLKKIEQEREKDEVILCSNREKHG
jgi:hypothetical protein